MVVTYNGFYCDHCCVCQRNQLRRTEHFQSAENDFQNENKKENEKARNHFRLKTKPAEMTNISFLVIENENEFQSASI